MLMSVKAHTRHGFTIVELLIVIVVIAVLAAITIVTYQGVQQRANNVAIIDAASKSVRMVQAYIAANGKYPLTNSTAASGCVTTDVGCATAVIYSNNSTLTNNLSTIASLPRSVPTEGTDRYGILYYYYLSTRTMNGASAPVSIVYFLSGVNQQCLVSGVQTMGSETRTTATAGYSMGNDGGKTRCEISVPGPSA